VGVVVTAQPDDAGHLRVQVEVSPAPGVVIAQRADVIVALTEEQLTSDKRPSNLERVTSFTSPRFAMCARPIPPGFYGPAEMPGKVRNM